MFLLLHIAEVIVLQGLSGRDSFAWICNKHAFQELKLLFLQFWVNTVAQVEIHLFIIFVNLVVFCPLKKWFSHQENVENYSGWENVALRFNVDVFCQRNNLRCNVTWSSATIKQIFWNVCICGKPKIYDNGLHRILIPEHNVLGLQVPVHGSVLMHVGQAFQKAFHESFYLSFGKVAFYFLNFVE